MPKLKKQVKNAYYFFMVDRRSTLEAQGYRFPKGLQDVAGFVRGEWKDLSDAEKEPYNELAKNAKEMEKTNYENKFTTSGESYASLNRRMAAAEAEKAELKALFQNIVRSGNTEERIFVLAKAIPSCEVGLDNLTEKKEYYPLEIALAAFSLTDGFICQYSTLINTMSVPCGYASLAKDTSEETLLPQPGSKLFQQEAPSAVNYNEIMNKIRLFVETWCGDYPDGKFMIFATESDIRCIDGSLQWLVKNADENEEQNKQLMSRLKFYSLASLVIELAVVGHEINSLYTSELQQFRLAASAENLLSSGCYDYRDEITCFYHRKDDYCAKMHVCCLNYIMRRIFIILEEFCKAYSYRMTDRHSINSFSKTTLPAHLKERIPRTHSNQGEPPKVSPEIDRENGVDQQKYEAPHNDDKILQAGDFVRNATTRSRDRDIKLDLENRKGKPECDDVSVSKGEDTPTDFDLCYERRKRKRSSSPDSTSAHFSLGSAKYDRREDSSRSSVARDLKPHASWDAEWVKSDELPQYKNEEFGSSSSFSQSPRGRGRGFRRTETESSPKKDVDFPGLVDRPTTPPLACRPLGRGSRGPAFGN